MNFQGIKLKLLRFKRIFTTNWAIFISSHPCYITNYYHSKIAKMLKCGSSDNDLTTYQCLGCGQWQHKVNFSYKGKACPQRGKGYVLESMVKIGVCLFPRVRYQQGILTLPEQLRIPFHNHSNQKSLYFRFMILAESCLSELIQVHFKSDACEIVVIVFIHNL
ncbi:transposase zinc-binding domain-containing protein [Candidatus Enterovibrio escicola]|uniref:transposase zinc-binding domain-containing protein n=1 Tax=Candidatus Enterovibrio escicola TaxID=1927127 RepID=UPI000BE26809|nr:transposase zinc-binding domain-containing protein [Candidatus Enterovibrio escacola]